jgi:hypothetical protein
LGKGRGKVSIQRHIYLKFLKKFSGGMADEKKFMIKSKGNFIQKFLKFFYYGREGGKEIRYQ